MIPKATMNQPFENLKVAGNPPESKGEPGIKGSLQTRNYTFNNQRSPMSKTIKFVPTHTTQPINVEASFALAADGTLTSTAYPCIPLGSNYDEVAADLIQLYGLLWKFKIVVE